MYYTLYVCVCMRACKRFINEDRLAKLAKLFIDQTNHFDIKVHIKND